MHTLIKTTQMVDIRYMVDLFEKNHFPVGLVYLKISPHKLWFSYIIVIFVVSSIHMYSRVKYALAHYS